jgi:hypothetical protein
VSFVFGSFFSIQYCIAVLAERVQYRKVKRKVAVRFAGA